ncbi:hypothetical protein LINPERPRIM_LOCUS28475 [Linum perenne]
MEEAKLLMSNREQQDQKASASSKEIRKAPKGKATATATLAEDATSSPPCCSCGKAAEYGCSCCLCCVCCPLSVVWCCVKLPCKVGIRAAQAAKRQLTSGSSCCWSCGKKKPYYYSSSFSDLEFSPP